MNRQKLLLLQACSPDPYLKCRKKSLLHLAWVALLLYYSVLHPTTHVSISVSVSSYQISYSWSTTSHSLTPESLFPWSFARLLFLSLICYSNMVYGLLRTKPETKSAILNYKISLTQSHKFVIKYSIININRLIFWRK